MSERDFDDIADPELIARLAAWFGEGPVPQPNPDQLEADARRRASDELEAVVDVDLRDRIEAQRQLSSKLLVWANEPLESAIDSGLPRTRLPSGPMDELEQPEYEQPDDIRHALREDNTPQSVLRDLFRPIRYFGDVRYRVSSEATHVGAPPTEIIRELMTTSWAANTVPPAAQVIRIDMTDLRSRLSEPWEDSAVDPADRAADDDMDDHFRWFGLEGGYDPDL